MAEERRRQEDEARQRPPVPPGPIPDGGGGGGGGGPVVIITDPFGNETVQPTPDEFRQRGQDALDAYNGLEALGAGILGTVVGGGAGSGPLRSGGQLMRDILADGNQINLLRGFNRGVGAGGPVSIPAGLSRVTLERAREIARQAVENGIGGPVQQARLDAITQALSRM